MKAPSFEFPTASTGGAPDSARAKKRATKPTVGDLQDLPKPGPEIDLPEEELAKLPKGRLESPATKARLPYGAQDEQPLTERITRLADMDEDDPRFKRGTAKRAAETRQAAKKQAAASKTQESPVKGLRSIVTGELDRTAKRQETLRKEISPALIEALKLRQDVLQLMNTSPAAEKRAGAFREKAKNVAEAQRKLDKTITQLTTLQDKGEKLGAPVFPELQGLTETLVDLENLREKLRIETDKTKAEQKSRYKDFRALDNLKPEDLVSDEDLAGPDTVRAPMQSTDDAPTVRMPRSPQQRIQDQLRSAYDKNVWKPLMQETQTTIRDARGLISDIEASLQKGEIRAASSDQLNANYRRNINAYIPEITRLLEATTGTPHFLKEREDLKRTLEALKEANRKLNSIRDRVLSDEQRQVRVELNPEQKKGQEIAEEAREIMMEAADAINEGRLTDRQRTVYMTTLREYLSDLEALTSKTMHNSGLGGIETRRIAESFSATHGRIENMLETLARARVTGHEQAHFNTVPTPEPELPSGDDNSAIENRLSRATVTEKPRTAWLTRAKNWLFGTPEVPAEEVQTAEKIMDQSVRRARVMEVLPNGLAAKYYDIVKKRMDEMGGRFDFTAEQYVTRLASVKEWTANNGDLKDSEKKKYTDSQLGDWNELLGAKRDAKPEDIETLMMSGKSDLRTTRALGGLNRARTEVRTEAATRAGAPQDKNRRSGERMRDMGESESPKREKLDTQLKAIEAEYEADPRKVASKDGIVNAAKIWRELTRGNDDAKRGRDMQELITLMALRKQALRLGAKEKADSYYGSAVDIANRYHLISEARETLDELIEASSKKEKNG